MRQCIPWVKCRNRARKLRAKKQTNTVRGKLGFKPVHALRQMLQTALWKLAKLENMRNCKENWWCGPVHAIGQVLQGDLLLCITATLAATKTFNTLKTFVAWSTKSIHVPLLYPMLLFIWQLYMYQFKFYHCNYCHFWIMDMKQRDKESTVVMK